jgi:hypothetical protein
MNNARRDDYGSRRQFGQAVHDMFDHVKSHDPGGVHAALILVANADPDAHDERDEQGNKKLALHICQFGGGDPEILAGVLLDAIDSLGEANPDFKKALGQQALLRAVKPMMETLKEALQMNDAAPAAKEALAKVMAMAAPKNDKEPGDGAN